MTVRSTIFYLKVGTNGNLIPTALLAPDKNSYDSWIRSSVLNLSAWLNKYVLSGDDQSIGVNVRQRLSAGLVFNEDMHSYLISSYNYWRQRDLVKKRKQQNLEKEKLEREKVNKNKATSIQGRIRDYVDVPVAETLDELITSCDHGYDDPIGTSTPEEQRLSPLFCVHDDEVITTEKRLSGAPYGAVGQPIIARDASPFQRVEDGNNESPSSIGALLTPSHFGADVCKSSVVESAQEIAVGHVDGSIRYYRFDGEGERLTLVPCKV